MKIKNVVVIGSGTMGSGIAAHLCNANIPVTLLDLKTEISEKNLLKFLPGVFPGLDINYSDFNVEEEESEVPKCRSRQSYTEKWH